MDGATEALRVGKTFPKSRSEGGLRTVRTWESASELIVQVFIPIFLDILGLADPQMYKSHLRTW